MTAKRVGEAGVDDNVDISVAEAGMGTDGMSRLRAQVSDLSGDGGSPFPVVCNYGTTHEPPLATRRWENVS